MNREINFSLVEDIWSTRHSRLFMLWSVDCNRNIKQNQSTLTSVSPSQSPYQLDALFSCFRPLLSTGTETQLKSKQNTVQILASLDCEPRSTAASTRNDCTASISGHDAPTLSNRLPGESTSTSPSLLTLRQLYRSLRRTRHAQPPSYDSCVKKSEPVTVSSIISSS